MHVPSGGTAGPHYAKRMTMRSLARIKSLPPPAPGQFGPQHTAIEVINPIEWQESLGVSVHVASYEPASGVNRYAGATAMCVLFPSNATTESSAMNDGVASIDDGAEAFVVA